MRRSRDPRSLAIMGPLLVILACASGHWRPTRAQEETQATLTVLTFNVWHGLRSGESRKRFPGEKPERKERRFALQVQEIQRLDPDLLLFQEVNPNQPESRKYARALGYDEIHKVTSCGLHLGGLLKIPSNVNEGIAILAKPGLGLRRVGKNRLSGNALCSATWGFQTKESRYALFGEITVSGSKILVATTHLFSAPFVLPDFEDNLELLVRDGVLTPEQRDEIVAERERKRQRNTAEVKLLLQELEKRRTRLAGSGAKLPAILGGDFNAEPDTPGILAVGRAGWQEAGTGAEFHTWDPVTNHVNYGIGTKRVDPLPTFGLPEVEELLAHRSTTPRQIDHIFVSPDLESVSARRVLDQEVEGMYLSDHFGILATIRLP